MRHQTPCAAASQSVGFDPRILGRTATSYDANRGYRSLLQATGVSPVPTSADMSRWRSQTSWMRGWHGVPMLTQLVICEDLYSRQECEAVGSVRTIIAYADRRPQPLKMNQIVAASRHALFLSICGPVGPLNRCWAS